MNLTEVENSPELQRVLWACYEFRKGGISPPHEGNISFEWIIDTYKERFGSGFHPTKLYWLTKYGFLTQAEVVRGGRRRYYKLVNPDKVLLLLQKWDLA